MKSLLTDDDIALLAKANEVYQHIKSLPYTRDRDRGKLLFEKLLNTCYKSDMAFSEYLDTFWGMSEKYIIVEISKEKLVLQLIENFKLETISMLF